MFASIKYNLAHLFDFAGREDRPTFWWYMLAIVILNLIAYFAITVPMTMGAMSAAMDAAGSGDEAAVRAAMAQQLADKAPTLIWTGIVIGIANLVLVAAAFVRRLRDAGQSMLWAALAGVVHVVNLVLSIGQVERASEMMRQAAQAGSQEEAMALQGDLAWQSLLGWVPILLVVIFGLLNSKRAADA